MNAIRYVVNYKAKNYGNHHRYRREQKGTHTHSKRQNLVESDVIKNKHNVIDRCAIDPSTHSMTATKFRILGIIKNLAFKLHTVYVARHDTICTLHQAPQTNQCQ